MNFSFGSLSGVHCVYMSTGNAFSLDGEITFMADGKTAEGLRWDAEGGTLSILNSTSELVYRFQGVELVNGVAVATGYSQGGIVHRALMCEKKPLGDSNWRICVSSHSANSKDVMQKLLKSIHRAGVDLSKVTVIVGSVPLAEAFSATGHDGVLRVSSEKNLKGFTALLGVCREGVDYHLLLHDTCTVAEDFKARIENIDMGLNPDIVLFGLPGEGLELGIYSERFLSEQDDLDALSPSNRLKMLWSRANVAVVAPVTKIVKPPEDHYHNGFLRQEWRMTKVGISKFKSMGGRR